MSARKRFSSVWDAIEDTPQQAAGMRARSKLLMALQAWVRSSGMIQADAAASFGITRPRMSDLMRGKGSVRRTWSRCCSGRTSHSTRCA